MLLACRRCRALHAFSDGALDRSKIPACRVVGRRLLVARLFVCLQQATKLFLVHYIFRARIVEIFHFFISYSF